MLTDNREDTGILRGLGLDRADAYHRRVNNDLQPERLIGDDTETNFVFNVSPRHSSHEAYGATDQTLDPPDAVPHLEQFSEPRSGEHEMSRNDQPNISALESEAFEEDLVQQINKDSGRKQTARKKLMISKHGIKYPSLPSGVIKQLATNFARTGGNKKTRISKETLDSIIQASHWFFEQASDDLSAYSTHAGRRTIDETDVLTLMAR